MSPFQDNRPLKARCTSTLCVAGALLASCAATSESAKTDLHYMVAGVRVDPPRPGQNTIYVEFQDQTAQGGDFEEAVYDGLIDAIEDRGYVYTDDFYAADYVLWASLRLFSEAGTAEEADRTLVALGGIAGGIVTAGVIQAAGGSPSATWIGGLAGGGVAGGVTAWALQENSWMMVTDLQLGKKVEGGVITNHSNQDEKTLGQTTRGGDGTSFEGGASLNESQKRQEYIETRVHAEMEQRVMAIAKGRRLEKDVAREALVPKLIDGIKSAMPKVGRSRSLGYIARGATSPVGA